MIERFQGDDLIQALKRQTLVECSEEVARRVATQARHAVAKRGEIVIQEGSETSDLYFILDGSVDIMVKGRRVNVRYAGQHVGEFYVTPDYLAVGSDKDFCRVPITPMTATRIAQQIHCTLPTTRMANAV